MRLSIIQLAPFVSDWKHLKLDDDDLRALEAVLLENLEIGPVMSGTGGLRKLRFAPPSRRVGKSGGARIGYAYFPENEWAFLVLVFFKSEKANLSTKERQSRRHWIAFGDQFRKDE